MSKYLPANVREWTLVSIDARRGQTCWGLSLAECLECGAPGYYRSTGLCRRCERECLGMHGPTAIGRCPGYECGALLAIGEKLCPDCERESEDMDADYA